MHLQCVLNDFVHSFFYPILVSFVILSKFTDILQQMCFYINLNLLELNQITITNVMHKIMLECITVCLNKFVHYCTELKTHL